MRTTKAQTCLHIHAVVAAPLLFAYLKVSYLDFLQAKFQFHKFIQEISRERDKMRGLPSILSFFFATSLIDSVIQEHGC